MLSLTYAQAGNMFGRNTDTDITDPAQVVQWVNRIISTLRIDDAPVKVDEVANLLGCVVGAWRFPTHLSHVNGFISPSDDELQIIVNEALPAEEKVFTIAHLLGHVVLHGTIIAAEPTNELLVLFNEPLGRQDQDARERAANIFAALLLIPDHVLSRYRELRTEDLAKIFGVTPIVVRYRLMLG